MTQPYALMHTYRDTHANAHTSKKAKAIVAIHAVESILTGQDALTPSRHFSVASGQILLETGLVSCRGAAHASWTMVYAPEVSPA